MIWNRVREIIGDEEPVTAAFIENTTPSVEDNDFIVKLNSDAEFHLRELSKNSRKEYITKLVNRVSEGEYRVKFIKEESRDKGGGSEETPVKKKESSGGSPSFDIDAKEYPVLEKLLEKFDGKVL